MKESQAEISVILGYDDGAKGKGSRGLAEQIWMIGKTQGAARIPRPELERFYPLVPLTRISIHNCSL